MKHRASDTVDDDAAFTRLDVVMMMVSSFVGWILVGPAMRVIANIRRMGR